MQFDSNSQDFPYPPALHGLTLNQVAKQLGLTRDEVNSMVGVIERIAGRKLPTRPDAQGNQQRFVSPEHLLAHMELAALLMKTDRLTASLAMEAALGVNLPALLPRLTKLIEDYYAIATMHQTLRSATDELVKTARTPHIYQMALIDLEVVRDLLETLEQQVKGWKVTAMVAMLLLLLSLLVIWFK